MRSAPFGRRNDSLSLPVHSSRTSRMSKVHFPVWALCCRCVGNVLSPSLTPDSARSSPFRGEGVVLEFFSQALIAGESLPHLTNFHDKLTNMQQMPLAIAGAACSPRMSCVQAPAHRVIRHALANPSQ